MFLHIIFEISMIYPSRDKKYAVGYTSVKWSSGKISELKHKHYSDNMLIIVTSTHYTPNNVLSTVGKLFIPQDKGWSLWVLSSLLLFSGIVASYVNYQNILNEFLAYKWGSLRKET